MADRVGQQLGNYRLLRLLGRGGFAKVYLGEHVFLKRRAALKVLLTSLEDENVEHFLSEAQTLARLEHPHIVRVFDFAVEQGTPFLAMDYAPRGTVLERHPRGSCLSLETTVAYVKQVAAALQYAHNHQVIHRDVKPENMLLGSQQQLMLSDFGISLFAPSTEQLTTQEMAGTLPYMAPEQIRGKPSFASDQYSLGIVVYEWLCGARPFAGSQLQLIHQHISISPPRLREKDPSLPEAVEEVVLRALAKDPEKRYVSVQMFAQALERASQEVKVDLRSDTEVTAPLAGISPVTPVSPIATSRRVFLSASPADEALAARIASDLQRRGIMVWNARQDNVPHAPDQENAARQAIRAVDVVLLVISPHAQSSESVAEHLRIASMYQRRLVFVWAAGDDIAAALPQEWGKTVLVDLIDAREGRYGQVLDEMVACLEEETPVAGAIQPEPAFESRNPYKGLRAFKQNDVADFFGRDTLVEELVDRMKAVLAPGQENNLPARLLAVIGPSGSGKSSVVMAGLLPRLQGGALPGSQEWVYLEPMVPGAHPLETLALTFAPRFPGRSLKSLRGDLEDDSARGLHLLVTQLTKEAGKQLVLLVDQFEELFTLTSSEQERQHFINLLVTAITEPQGAVVVVLTLRADMYDRPVSYPSLGRLIVQRQVMVWPMDVHDLRAVIKRPAALPDVQLAFEGSLMGDLLFEVQGQAGALPLLQFTLEQLFERRSEHLLTLKAYREIGGVRGALAKHAEDTYMALPSEEHRKLARALFLRLIDPGLTEQDTMRRRAALSELALPSAEQTELLQQVTASFLAARLLTTNEIAGTPTVEVSHEALIREWPRLSDWLREAREDIRLQQAISEDAAEWEQRGKPRDRLYRGSQLKEAKVWARRNTPSGNEVAFLRAGAAHRMGYIASVTSIVLVVLLLIGLSSLLYYRIANIRVPPDPTHVITLNDHGSGSLSNAIAVANPGSMITFDPRLRGTIPLTRGDLDITKNLKILGPGAGMLSISSSKSNHIVHVLPGVTVTISDLTFKGSNTSYSYIYNEGTLTLTNSTVSGNTADFGGGITNRGTLTLSNSTVSGNMATSDGGGIYNGGTLTLSNSTVSGNMATGVGGGIYNVGTLTLSNSTVSGNTATGDGGGIYNGFGDRLTLSNSTVSGNTATDSGGILNVGTLTLSNSTVSGNKVTGPNSAGGGILNVGTLTLSNSSVSGNTATGPNGTGGGIATFGTLTLSNSSVSGNTASADGGGIAVAGSQADITFCTIYGNTATGKGGGIASENGLDPNNNSHIQIKNSIVAGNNAHIGQDVAGNLTTLGYNLVGDRSGATFLGSPGVQSTDVLGVSSTDLKIDLMLRDNGGSSERHTLTLALLPGSPAIDAIPLQYCQVKGIFDSRSHIYTDQRGVKRPGGNENMCDIGAYESSP